MVEYAQSWEGRKLAYAIIGSDANMRRLDEIRSGMHKLADPRQTFESRGMPRAATEKLSSLVEYAQECGLTG